MKNSDFLAAYIECALWSSMDESDEAGGNPMDANYSPADIAPETLATMRSECADFLRAARSLIRQCNGYTIEQAAHDFWLTRNRHGAGFWDRELGDIGRKLTDLAHAAGEVNLYVGENGSIYQ